MSGQVLLDSDVVIEVLRRKNADLLTQWFALGESQSQVYYSPITVAEVWRGAREAEFEATATLFSSISCLVADAAVGRVAGDYLKLYAASHGLEIADAMIAATAFRYGLRLWTRNRKHYPMREVRFY
ncbi:MAG TPA: type II toxin-antitoxin system VapC family toxin [Bryobacteraceae bacterium]|nr:type II toxin-antitoxin system VapC family toxin [Bryobacteraceae bacterium]